RANAPRNASSPKLLDESHESRSVLAGDCFHNFVLPEVAYASGSVTPLDALVVINRINQSFAGNQTDPNSASRFGMVDVDADASVTPLDALVVIDQLNSQNSSSASGLRASRVEVQRRIERIEQAIASNVLPPSMTLEDAKSTLETLRKGGRPELGDHVISGVLRWKQDDNPSSSDPSEPVDVGIIDDRIEQDEMKRLERFIEALSERLKAFNVSSDVIENISSQMIEAHKSGTPLDINQVRDRLAVLGVNVDAILPQPNVPVRPERPELPGRPELPERPERPERPEQPERPIMPALMVTEPIAESILTRLKNAGVTADVIETISTEIWGAINAGAPLDLQQVRARLDELGVDWERLHAPPINTLPVIRPPVFGGIDPIQRVLPVLGRLGISREVALTIYAEARAAAAIGKPLTIDQIIARLKELGISLDGINFPAV
ncbi:MAG: dockerin type I domain-containing protein, partial [Planctomycetota bacterium]